jgi:uncharacterized protein YccT (UPF0319 family)
LSKFSSLLIVAVCGLSATSSASAAEPLAQAVSQSAHLQVPELIQIMAIDGQERTGNFFGSRAMTLDLSAGEHVLSVRYSQLFQLGADDHDIIKSKPMAIRFTAEAGKTYQLNVNPPKRYEAAKEFAKQPDIRLVDKTSGTSQQATLIKSYAEASLVDSIGKAFQSSEDSAAIKATTASNVQLLQDIWQRASTEERQAFAAWLASKAATAK